MANAPVHEIDRAVTALACAGPDGRITAVEAARELDRMGLLRDSPSRPGLPLRNLLRAGRIANARQEYGRWWVIECPQRGARPRPGRTVSSTMSPPGAPTGRRSSADYERQRTSRGRWQLSNPYEGEEVLYHPDDRSWSYHRAGESDRRFFRSWGQAARAMAEDASPGSEGRADEWSASEVRAIVADYLEMLDAELAERPYNKAEHRRALLPRLDRRSEPAIEFKHRNISAVMELLGLPRIKGYVPARAIQAELIDEVRAQTEGGRTLRLAVQTAPVPATTGPLRLVDPPARATPGRRGRAAVPRIVDFGVLEEENRRLGRSGEEVVRDFEVARLRAAGRSDLARRVRWVSKEEGDGAGYDIASFTVEGAPLHIEVKTTRSGPTMPFYLSAWELGYAQDHPDVACIYRVYDLGPHPKVFVVHPPYEHQLLLEPVTYRARR